MATQAARQGLARISFVFVVPRSAQYLRADGMDTRVTALKRKTSRGKDALRAEEGRGEGVCVCVCLLHAFSYAHGRV